MSLLNYLLKPITEFTLVDYLFYSFFLLFIISFSCLIAVYIKYRKERSKNKIVLSPLDIESDKEKTPKSIEYLSCVEQGYSVYQGYIDINYLKELTGELKSKSPELDDEKFADEFETYLLNFVSRQPAACERITLSEYVGKLIKKLAKYS